MGCQLVLALRLGPPLGPRPWQGRQRMVEIVPLLGPPELLHCGAAGPHCRVGHRPLVGSLSLLTRASLHLRVGEGLQEKRAAPDRPLQLQQQRTGATATSRDKQRHRKQGARRCTPFAVLCALGLGPGLQVGSPSLGQGLGPRLGPPLGLRPRQGPELVL